MFSFVCMPRSLCTDDVPCHKVGISWRSLRCSYVPTSRCTDFPLALSQCFNPFHCSLLLLWCGWIHYCCSKIMWEFIYHRRFYRIVTLNANFTILALITELPIHIHLFVTKLIKQFEIAHAQSLRMCCFEETLLHHLLSWCCFHGFYLRCS